MKVKYEFEISEHFEVGNCSMCPLSFWDVPMSILQQGSITNGENKDEYRQ